MRLISKIKTIFTNSQQKGSQYNFLKVELQKKANRGFSKKMNEFRKKHKRKPSRDEIFLLAVKTSHDVIKQKGRVGHWTRQRVRKYLLLKNNIRANYKMQHPKK